MRAARGLPIALAIGFQLLFFAVLLARLGTPLLWQDEAETAMYGRSVLEFGVPKGLARPLWDLYVKAALPLAGRLLRNGWPEVGDFLGGSIRDYWQHHPLDRQLEWWYAAGLRAVEVRRLSFGAAVVMWGRKT